MDRPAYGLVAGIDEAGRGALAGPVVAGIVVLGPEGSSIDGLDDSKRLTPGDRERLAAALVTRALAWSVGRAEASEIDSLNILEATMLAMRRAYESLTLEPAWVQVDGNRYPELPCAGEAIVRGDASVPAIMAASILAKVARDREMAVLDVLYPGYGFAAHKGYPTGRHRVQLCERGPCAAHRVSFGPVRDCRPAILPVETG